MVITARFNRQLGRGLMASVAVASLFLAGCSSDTTETKGTPRVVVFGESLVDVGTFGFKYTTQGSVAIGAGSNKVFPEVIAASLGAAQPCAHFSSLDNGLSYTKTANCTGFGVGGGRIVSDSPPSPKALEFQLDAAASAIGSYTNDDVVVMSISGNDGAALVSAYIPFALGVPGARANFVALTSGELGEQTVNGLLNNPNAGAATVGIAYMTALATKNFNLVKSKVLDKGANKVVLANSPKLTVTPLLAFQLAALQAQTSAQDGPEAGALARAKFEGLIDTWVKSYNEQLVVKFTPEPRVVVFDLYSLMGISATTPATYGFTNSRDASCPPTITSSGPTYDLKTCTEELANRYITSGQAGLISKAVLNGNVTGFLYSDNFHPTPRGHEVAGQVALNLINARGWAAR